MTVKYLKIFVKIIINLTWLTGFEMPMFNLDHVQLLGADCNQEINVTNDLPKCMHKIDHFTFKILALEKNISPTKSEF